MSRSLALAAGALIGCARAGVAEQQHSDAPPQNQVDAPMNQIDAPPGIDAPVCATSPCDIQTQCGCDGTTACDVDFSDLMGTACRMKTDTGVEGTSCGGTFGSPTQCAKKYICI